MKPNIKKLVFLSAAILSAAVSCTSEGENGHEKPTEPSTRLIRRIERIDGVLTTDYDFEYDSSGRLSKVTVGGDEVSNYSYYEKTIVFSSELFNVTEYLDESGRLTKTVAVFDDGAHPYTSEYLFRYDEKTGDLVLPGFLYSNGNCVENQGFFKYEYGKDTDNMNLDIFHTLIAGIYSEPFIPFYSFPHIHNRNLCTGVTDIYEFSPTHYSISYEYDDSGNVVQINVGDDQIIRLYY